MVVPIWCGCVSEVDCDRSIASRKSKKDKGQRQDDEKENASSPTKVKKSSQKYEKEKKPEPAKQPVASPPESKRPSSHNYACSASGLDQHSNGVQNGNEPDLSDDANRAKRRSLRDHVTKNGGGGGSDNFGGAQQALAVETNMTQGSSTSQQPSPLSSKSAATTINIQHPRHPVLSASDAAHSASFVRGVSDHYFSSDFYFLCHS